MYKKFKLVLDFTKGLPSMFQRKQITPKHFQKSSKETKAVKVVIPTPYDLTNIVRLVLLIQVFQHLFTPVPWSKDCVKLL